MTITYSISVYRSFNLHCLILMKVLSIQEHLMLTTLEIQRLVYFSVAPCISIRLSSDPEEPMHGSFAYAAFE